MRNFKLFVKICNIYNTLNIHLKSNWKPGLMKKFNAYAALYFVLKLELFSVYVFWNIKVPPVSFFSVCFFQFRHLLFQIDNFLVICNNKLVIYNFKLVIFYNKYGEPQYWRIIRLVILSIFPNWKSNKIMFLLLTW